MTPLIPERTARRTGAGCSAAAARGGPGLRRRIDSPLGPLVLQVDTSGALTALFFGTDATSFESGPSSPPARRALDDAVAQIEEYFRGRRHTFDLALDTGGTPFQEQVWARVLAIPFGATATYGRLAAEVGRPDAARAVGHANARNPIPVVIPCHRVVGSTGALTGYGGGLDAKRLLLALERDTT